MKRKSLLFLLLFALIAPWTAMGQATLTVHEGTVTSNTVPMYVFYWDDYTRAQTVFPSSDLEDMVGGTITAITFYTTSYNIPYTSVATFDAYLAEVSDASISSYIDRNAATTVMTNATAEFVSDGNSGGTVTLTLSTPYVYGGGNLLFGCDNNTDAGYKSINFYGQTVNGASISGSNTAAGGDIPTNQRNFLPKTTFTFTPSDSYCPRPTHVTVVDVTSNSAVITWQGDAEDGYKYQVKRASDSDWPTYVEQVYSDTLTLTGLSPQTAYQFRIMACCSDMDLESTWTEPLDFSTTAVAVAVNDSWSDDFEGNTCVWELINGNCADAWVWGTAVNNGGSHALYISDDSGTTYQYSHDYVKVFAAKLLNFTEGKFEFSYDWTCKGESNYDFLRVALVPSTQTLTAGSDYSTISTTSLPSGWIALDGGSKLNLQETWQNKDVAINVAAGNYYMVFAWRSDNSNQYTPPAAVDNVSITRVACEYEVTNLIVSHITNNSAYISWDGDEGEQWQVVYADNALFENATEEIVRTATYTMTPLSAATTYYVKVRAHCGGQDFGSWSAVNTFLTECDALSEYPYTENFDSYTATSGFLPLCWDRINTGTSYNSYPYVYGYSSNSPSNCLYFYSYGSSSSTTISDQYAILPPMENLAGKQIGLSAKGYNNQSTFKIGLMTDPTDATTFTAIATQELTTSYQEFFYYVPADATANYIAILMEKPDASSSVTRGVYIDDISIDFPPSCFKPTGLVASNPTAHGATLNWNLTDETQTAWDVEVADDPEFRSVVQLNENVGVHENYLLSGLNPETEYFVHVRGNCGAQDVSEWSNPVSFTTTIACPAPTGFAVAELSAYTAKLRWTGTSESYTLYYRTAAYTDGLGETFTGTTIPAGWENKIGLLSDVMEGAALTTGSQWSFGTANGVFDQHAKINIYGSSYSERHGWLISPAFTVLDNASLNFDLALTAFSGTLGAPATDGDDDKFVVLISTDEEATWTILRQWDNEEGSTYVYNNINSTATGEHVSINLSSYAGQSVRIAFYGESTVSNADNNLHIDNVGCGIYHEAGQWHPVVADTTAATITGLTPETAYEAKVQGDCGDDGLSLETNLITFTTLNTCPTPTNLTVADVTATTADLNWHGSIDVESYTVRYRVLEHIDGGVNETFETTTLPSGWKNKSGLLSNVMEGTAMTNTTQWYFGASNGVFDSHARINIYGSGSSERHGWLITPTFTLASSTFTFDLALTAYSGSDVPAPATSGTDDKFVVLISTDNGETWTILRQWDNEEGSTYVYNNIANTAEGEQVSIDLSSYVGQTVCIAFYGESTESNADNNLHIDNVIIGTPTTIPTGEWQTAGSTTTDVTLTGLTQNTPYEAQVKSDCSDPEEWSNTVTFTTTILTTATQTVALNEGWNWFSTNVVITLDELKNALVEALPETAITIKGKSGSTKYVVRTHRWNGSLDWDITSMYKIEVTANCEIALEGMPMDPAQYPITIAPNTANWIGYPVAATLTLAEAFANFNAVAVNGDVIQAKGGSARYNRGTWRPNGLTALEPGQGYIFVPASSVTSDRILVYPSSAK